MNISVPTTLAVILSVLATMMLFALVVLAAVFIGVRPQTKRPRG